MTTTTLIPNNNQNLTILAFTDAFDLICAIKHVKEGDPKFEDYNHERLGYEFYGAPQKFDPETFPILGWEVGEAGRIIGPIYYSPRVDLDLVPWCVVDLARGITADPREEAWEIGVWIEGTNAKIRRDAQDALETYQPT